MLIFTKFYNFEFSFFIGYVKINNREKYGVNMMDLLNKEKTILEVISGVYIFILILIFPLMVDKTGFFHILEHKWYSYVTIASVYLITCLIVFLYFLIIKKVNYFKNYKFSLVQILAVSFLGLNILSCFLSPYFKTHNLFIGVGRGEGLIVSSLYILTFLFITFFAKFQKRYISYFSIASILISFIEILQYIGFNPFNMYQGGIGTHNVSFMGTIGNIDFISAMYCILLPISFSAFIFLDENKYLKLTHLLSLLMGSFIFGIINVQSGKVAYLVILLLTFPFILVNNKRLSRFLITISTILTAYCINIIINPEYHYDLGRVNLYFQFNFLTLMFIIVIGLLIYLSTILKKTPYDLKNNYSYLKKYYLILGIGLVFSLVALYFINVSSGMLYEIHELLHGNFDDTFGTYRIFLWKRTLTLINQYPIFGSGPDTFALRFMAKYTADVAAIGPLTINDTAANVYLTMLINLGVIGLGNYLLFLFFQVKEGIKNVNQYSIILLITLLCYLVQDFFNLSVVIVSPIFWLLMGLHYISINEKANN